MNTPTATAKSAEPVAMTTTTIVAATMSNLMANLATLSQSVTRGDTGRTLSGLIIPMYLHHQAICLQRGGCRNSSHALTASLACTGDDDHTPKPGCTA